MAKPTTSYKEWLSSKLSDPGRAARYLNKALEDSPAAFLKALRKVSDSFEKKQLAATAGVSRESLYRMMSDTGNPTLSSLEGILRALGLRFTVEPAKGAKVEITQTARQIVVQRHPGGNLGSLLDMLGRPLGEVVVPFLPRSSTDANLTSLFEQKENFKVMNSMYTGSAAEAFASFLPVPLLADLPEEYAGSTRNSLSQLDGAQKGIHLVIKQPEAKAATKAINASEPLFQLQRKRA